MNTLGQIWVVVAANLEIAQIKVNITKSGREFMELVCACV